jgi:hypothetical protein
MECSKLCSSDFPPPSTDGLLLRLLLLLPLSSDTPAAAAADAAATCRGLLFAAGSCLLLHGRDWSCSRRGDCWKAAWLLLQRTSGRAMLPNTGLLTQIPHWFPNNRCWAP